MMSKPKRLPSAIACRMETGPKASGADLGMLYRTPTYVGSQDRRRTGPREGSEAAGPVSFLMPRRPAAVIFDFDGVVLDSETPEYESHRRISERCGVTLTVGEWCGVIGTWSDGHDEQWFERLCAQSAAATAREG